MLAENPVINKKGVKRHDRGKGVLLLTCYAQEGGLLNQCNESVEKKSGKEPMSPTSKKQCKCCPYKSLDYTPIRLVETQLLDTPIQVTKEVLK